PLKWKKSNMVFVNSMGDVFHEKVPLDFIKQVFGVMNIADQHFYQVLTKRAKRLLELSEMIKWDSHIWMGVTVENKTFKYRIDYLRKTPAKTKFLSLEPLLGSLGELNLSGIDWVIVGGESGPRARSIEADWAREVRDQCIEQNIPFFFKQWGGVQKKKNGRVLDGVTWDEMPTRELTAV
ncbi:MAG: phage Gp37/Gp68 family protein, partial [Candidatus Scalindua sp.]|nr:phage Gp37/Gp68 family protein [Candidatus Scalindua sp.]